LKQINFIFADKEAESQYDDFPDPKTIVTPFAIFQNESADK